MSLTARQIAEICHEANRGLQAVQNDSQPSEPWWCIPAEVQEVAVLGVERALLGAPPDELHDAWCIAMRARGWKYGDVRDCQAKTHPNLRPWLDLPVPERAKTALFLAIVEWAKTA